MQKLKIIGLFLALATVFVSRTAFGFAQGGPIGNGGDNWQVTSIDYGVPGDINDAPKNIGEEYRRITPTVYYAYDANFLGFFGLAGSTNVDEAFTTLNTVSNVDSYSPDLSEWPTTSKDVNFTASALGLTDIKSEVLGEMMSEQMGLLPPERYTWTLHARIPDPFPGAKCPGDVEFIVVQRNFDIVPSSFSQVQYSPYVNDTLYSFQIIQACSGPDPLAIAVPFAVDPFADAYSSVASGVNTLEVGQFFNGLTRDDVGGLRYLYSTNTIYTEATAPSGALLITTNAQAPQLFGPTLSLSLLFSEALTNPPDVLATNFPGLQFLEVSTNFVNFVTTNITAFFTNQSVPPVFSNTVAGGLTNGFYFTNQPGPTVIDYDPTTFIQFQTLDLALFSDQSVTDSPATLQALYPGLQISSVIAIPKLMFATNFVTYLTNITGAPFQGAPVAKTAISSITSFFGTNYIYGFGNVFTNHAYTNRIVVTQNIWITNLTGAPFGSPFVARTNFITTTLHLVSGDFFIIPTNWCGFEVLGVSPVNILPPYGTGPTNTIVFTGFNSNSVVTNPVAGGNAFGLIQNSYDIYTNFNIVLRPGICEPVLVLSTNAITNAINTYNYVFANVVTNHYFTNSPITEIITNIGPCPGGSTAILCTNSFTTNFYANLPSGDFYIIPPNLCGFSILSTQSSMIAFTTNTFIVATNGTGVTNAGQQYSVTFITSYTNYTFKVVESTCTQGPTGPALREGSEHVQFVRLDYDSLISQFINPVTNYFSMVKVTNSQAVPEFYQRVVTTPDVILSAADLTPGTAAVLINFFSRNTANYDQSTVLPGLAGPGTIAPGLTMTLNKVGPVFLNGGLNLYGLTTNSFLNGTNQISLLAWGSFDGSSNAPIVYPDGQSLADLENQIFINVSPSTVPDGTNGVPYSVSFTVSGGSPQYTISAPNVSALVPGLSMATVTSTNTATLSGTPASAGTFNFNLQVTDSINRVVNLNYPITIH